MYPIMIFRFKRRDQLVPPVEGIQLREEISFDNVTQMRNILFFLHHHTLLISFQGRRERREEERRTKLRGFLVCILNKWVCNLVDELMLVRYEYEWMECLLP